ncbi:hypothetical protein HPP92_018178 [Vanilla planifolia]|uniref:Core-2/I-branching beta-1,6-N-acetylglucosaminyltransferase family protein n=1 Tax=Vanilla planifolia TaxID=51239 RepID=A0A835UQD2_VANPL|nr:hypothetical protein HPP92_018767 [Vanilla planifolia]KAG0468850.1 hypothetical protein HPP92_018178 [Vanilla planifolia]
MCDAERRLLGNALLDPSNRWFVLLSESCIPLHSFCSTYTFLNSSTRSFVDCFDDPGVDGRGRYNPQMSPFIRPHQWRKGSQWFEVGRELALFIVQDTRYYRSFKEFCRPPCYVDEHYFPTMLHLERPGLIANRSVTYADWSRGGPHPATFGMGDVTEDFLKLRIPRTHFLFARKFAPGALKKLLRLAPAVFGYG